MTESKKGFDRSKFKGAKISVNKDSTEKAKKDSETKFEGRAGYLKIASGKNVVRIAPPHDENKPSVQSINKAWLPRKVDGELKNMPIFSSKTHSPIDRDIIDEYVAFVTSLMYKEHSKDEAKKKLAPINGYRSKDGKWVSGIRHNLGFVAYGWIGEEFGRIEINRTVNDRMNELSIDEESDDPITVDPFSDPNTGVAVIIEYDPSADSSKKYKVNRGSKARPLTDEQLMHLSEFEPLDSIFNNAYTREDFNNSIEGLRIFDAKHGYGVMEMEEFIDIMEEIQELVWNCPEIRESYKSDDDGGDAAPTKSVKKAAPTTPTTAKPRRTVSTVIVDDMDEEDGDGSETKSDGERFIESNDDGLDDLDIDELKELIIAQKMDVVIKPAYPKSKIISLIREAADAHTAKSAPKRKPSIEEVEGDSIDDLPFDKKDDTKKSGFRSRLNKLK